MHGLDATLPLLLSISQWAIRLGALIYVPFRRSPEAAKGWLLLFFVAPWPALGIYWLIGRPRHPRWRRKRVRQLPHIVAKAAGRAEAALQRGTTLEEPGVTIAKLAEAVGRLPAVSASRIDLEPDYERMVDRLVADIDAARHHVHLMFYIFASDATGTKVLDALVRAEQRGVQCRLLIDAIGSLTWRRAIAERLEDTGVELHVVLPIRLFSRVTRADLRNHRKLAVIDGHIGWVGSQNIIDPDATADLPNQELMARVTGLAVAELQVVFVGDWYLETDTELADKALFPMDGGQPMEGTGAAQIVPSGPDYPKARIDMVFSHLAETARRRITLATPYFVPSESLLFALRSAALRGLEVRLIISGRTDSRIVDYAQSSYFLELMEAGVKIFLSRDCFLHAKHISMDDHVALVGSSNVDMRSFELNSEVCLISYDPSVVERLKAVEERTLACCRELDLERWKKRGLVRQLLSHMARLVSPLL
ncbi:cardiolipin synthase [Consotaella salsifontis]|uniref:Cardiolipin synthase n=1 Tax=Consotaella salsifontis TaxID=1365950 RepID=A0A1T4T4N6_9HYPH|nr:cardiolipin synthase [Consotaella salsifontis]SKA35423.1 cardiolipin synthase [Consotaella salsifontis]